MSRWVGVIGLLIGSEVLGLIFGEWSFRLFRQAMPPIALSQFNTGAAHIAYIANGALAGLVIFAWSLFVIFMSRLMQRAGSDRSSKTETADR